MERYGLTAQVSAIFAVLMGLLLVAPAASAAQSANTQTLVGGQTVTWDAPWSLDPELSISEEGFDLLAVESTTGLVGIGSYGTAVSGGEVRDIVIEAFAGEVGLRTVDRGDYDNVSYSLDISTTDGISLGIFTLVIEFGDGALISILIAPVESFQSSMESAQAAITINDSSVFEGVDAAEMQDRLNAVNPGQATQQPVPGPTEGASLSEPADDGVGLVGSINANLDRGIEADDPSAGTAATTTAALLPNSFVIPSSGVTVSWSDDWTVAEQSQRTIQLESSSQLAFLRVFDAGPSPGTMSAADLAQDLVQQEQLVGMRVLYAVDSGSDPNRKIIVLSEPDLLGEIYRIYDLTLGPAHSTGILLSVPKVDIETGISTVAASVEVNGEPALIDLEELVPELLGSSGI